MLKWNYIVLVHNGWESTSKWLLIWHVPRKIIGVLSVHRNSSCLLAAFLEISMLDFFLFFAYGSESIISKKRQTPFLFIYLLIYLFSFLFLFFFFLNGDLFCLICGNKGLQNGVFTFFRTICHSNMIEVILNKSYSNSWFPIVNLVFMKIYVLGLWLKMLWTNQIEGFFKPHYHKKY